jgi:acyl dehydratase
VTSAAGFRTAALSRERIAQFSMAMHDANPVHLDDVFCRSIGLPGVIAPGGISVVAIAHEVALHYGLASVVDIDVTFRSPIQADESLRCAHEVVGEEGDLVVLAVKAIGADDSVRADGVVRVRRIEGEGR